MSERWRSFNFNSRDDLRFRSTDCLSPQSGRIHWPARMPFLKEMK
jgi:hypothetical protein